MLIKTRNLIQKKANKKVQIFTNIVIVLKETQTIQNTVRRDMFKCLMKELDKIKPLKTECILYLHERKYAGRVDAIGNYDKKLCLIKFRTTNNKSESDGELAFLQTAAYAYVLAYHEMTGSKIQDLVLNQMTKKQNLEVKYVHCTQKSEF